ncbi:nitrous oxide reductase accessory protein NosL [Bacillus sp. FSL W8-1127]|nr:nitrous oxide reductase accessory protein NosL [Bacillus smithii]
MNMKKVWYAIALLGLFLIISGCGKKAEPVAINPKTDTCEYCHMGIMDNQYATEAVLANNKTMKFDDLGCMYKWISENKDQKIQAKFVRDFNTKKWLEAEKATYVYAKSLKTPMSYNVVAFKNKNDAQSFAKKNNGTVLSYDDLNSHKWVKNKDMMKKMKGNM